jgi:hypothetical protein
MANNKVADSSTDTAKVKNILISIFRIQAHKY